jgi:hypothetical protein
MVKIQSYISHVDDIISYNSTPMIRPPLSAMKK